MTLKKSVKKCKLDEDRATVPVAYYDVVWNPMLKKWYTQPPCSSARPWDGFYILGECTGTFKKRWACIVASISYINHPFIMTPFIQLCHNAEASYFVWLRMLILKVDWLIHIAVHVFVTYGLSLYALHSTRCAGASFLLMPYTVFWCKCTWSPSFLFSWNSGVCDLYTYIYIYIY